MKIIKIGESKSITAYHGTNKLFEKFDLDFTAQSVFWFSEDIDRIKSEISGAVSSRFILKVKLNVNKVAGWDEYDKYFLSQIFDMGYDAVHLDTDWVIFNPEQIQIEEKYERQSDGSYEKI